jgi:hypothetical protein
MPTYLVNLDALIPREYFEATSDAQFPKGPPPPGLKITDLEFGSFTYSFLRKPEFQRETSNWGPAKIAELVEGFLNGDLIPSLIMWRADNGNTFVIDGAHRLSAFIAWVNDDYGDRQISRPFFNDYIPKEQLEAANRTRHLLNSTVGSYHDLQQVAKFPNIADAKRLRFAQNIGASALALQWVAGDASTAERSFFTINQKATPIDPTELTMIKGRHKSNALATRALIRAGTGHKYWSGFAYNIQSEIENISREIYEMLFVPAIEEPLKTLDLPVAGRGYSPDSVKMVYELVNFVNRVPAKSELEDDTDGSRTLAYLKAVRRSASLIAGNEPRSLGLHPVVYFYGATGRFQASAFLAVVAFVRELDENDQLRLFTENRERFEEFLVEYRNLANLVGREYGALQRGVPPLLKMYKTMLSSFDSGLDGEQVLHDLGQQPELTFVLGTDNGYTTRRQTFSKGVKNAAFLKQALDNAMRCRLCGARMHFQSFTVDHIVRKADGGLGTADNAQLAHPYCNSGFKEGRHSRTMKTPTEGTAE